ncbi:MAG: AAA family ATPase [Bacteroidetes bacterium RIFOXYA12_FULL_35_11]|nr:MAG: AAA family ATPase [Bacteroidetes bacterium GWF2_35_48]OFY74652.1 MAG: AAA family ATPase [Bacteroidetes bacterium RIFOXYA12_FULL_35_11]OFZ03047.1 MAG: AAA family ATPase [Bacteroidetes bacterium RIFOXYC12_FULL_35_7]HBX49535.1 AAA family ATPase [Bacteroidales bacterium]
MKKQIAITCVNDGKKYYFDAGTDLYAVAEKIKPLLKYPVVGALVNNELQELSYEIFRAKHVRFVDITDTIGYRTCVRSLCFVLIRAFYIHYPEATLRISHAISKGLYCEFENISGTLTAADVKKIKATMADIIKQNIPFRREEMPNDEALEMYKNDKQWDKVKLFKDRKIMYTSVYFLEDTIDYFYGYLLPSTEYIPAFDLVSYHEGMLLRLHKQANPEELDLQNKEEKMFEILKEHKHWAQILGVENVGCMNELIQQNQVSELIKISESLHEKKIAKIADEIYAKKDKVRIVMLAGPSSSGKTSTCKRISIQLQVLGFKTMMISLDNYFVDREHTPRDENGEYDFECIEAIDINLFNQNLLDLMDGKEVELPKFDFAQGRKQFTGKKTVTQPNSIFIVEGIHGLNPKLSSKISDELKYKVYVSALTQIAIDNHNRIPTTDNRLLRRMIRDFKYRGYSALDTLKRWPSVKRGEEKNIFPFQEEADAIFNSALLYEISVLKRYAVPLLSEVPQQEDIYSEAMRLIKFLSFFKDVPEQYEREIPPTSILREFLGGSSFKY